MRCDDCDYDLPPGQEVERTRGKPSGGPGLAESSSFIEMRKRRPEGARRRDWKGDLAGVIVLAMSGGGIVALIAEIFR